MKFNSLVPEFEVSDIKNSLHFYVEVLGFKIEFDRPESKFSYLSLNDSQIMLCDMEENGEWQTAKMERPFGRGMHLQITVSNITKLIISLKENNIPIFRGPYEVWYPVKDKLVGTKEFLVQDPDGFVLRFQEELGERHNIEGFKTSQRNKISI